MASPFNVKMLRIQWDYFLFSINYFPFVQVPYVKKLNLNFEP